MSGPYIGDLGCQKRLRCDSDTSHTHQEEGAKSEILFSPSECTSDDPPTAPTPPTPPPSKKRRISPTEAEVTPKIHPSDHGSDVKIDQLGNIHGVDEKDRQFDEQIRLRGSARERYNDLPSDEWQTALSTAFILSDDYVVHLEPMRCDSDTSHTHQEEGAKSEIFFSPNECTSDDPPTAPTLPTPSPSKRRISPTEAEVTPKFRPSGHASNVNCCLHKIDQLGNVYGVDENDRQFDEPIRLRGSAREWYDDLHYILPCDQRKAALSTAFADSTDYVDRLEQMLKRTKTDSETLTQYYHDKLSLLKKCNISGTDAISCIIRGLPNELRADAKAYTCNTPEQLYYGFLSSLENFMRVETAYPARKSTWRRQGCATTSNTKTLAKVCYCCRKPGHEARDCRLRQRCDVCQRDGHMAAKCWFAQGVACQGERRSNQSGTKDFRDADYRPLQDGRVVPSPAAGGATKPANVTPTPLKPTKQDPNRT